MSGAKSDKRVSRTFQTGNTPPAQAMRVETPALGDSTRTNQEAGSVAEMRIAETNRGSSMITSGKQKGNSRWNQSNYTSNNLATGSKRGQSSHPYHADTHQYHHQQYTQINKTIHQ